MKLAALLFVAAGLALGAPSPAAAATAAPAKDGQKFGNWVASCAPAPKNDCLLVQTQVLEGGARLLELTIGKAGTKGEYAAIAMLPLGIHIPSGVILVIDGKQSPMTLLKCSHDGCQAVAPLGKANAGLLAKAKTILIGMVDEVTRKPVTITVSPDGLSAGMAALK